MTAVFFIHIPKTAGTSFREMLRRAQPRARCYPTRWQLLINRGQYPSMDQFMAAVHSGRYQVHAAHLPYAFGDRLASVSRWVMLRDPVERAISNLRHLRRHSAAYRQIPLERLARRRSVVANHLCNLQCQFLQAWEPSELVSFRRLQKPPPIDLESALANLHRCEFVGLTERFDESVRIAETVADRRLPHRRHANPSPDDGEPVGEELLRHLRALNESDQALYDAACAMFSDRLQRAGMGVG